MHSMHHMELSPLWRGQRAQDGVVEHVDAATKARFTSRDDRVHLGNLGPEFLAHLRRRQAFGDRHRGRFDTVGHVTESHDNQGFYAIARGGA